jgi:hypothetical protein
MASSRLAAASSPNTFETKKKNSPFSREAITTE